MRAVLMRTGSVPVHHRFVPSSPKVSLSRHNSIGESFSGERRIIRISLHANTSDDQSPPLGIRRVSSEGDIIGSKRSATVSHVFSKVSGAGSKSLPARIPEEEEVDVDYSGPSIWTKSGLPVEELGFCGDGLGKKSNNGGSNGNANRGGSYDDKSKIGNYYRELLKSNSNNSLLLMNYGKFLYEVERDVERAEEYYGRAILANPGDGEVLSLYGKLIWETQRDESKAKAYFDQAVHAAPNDCMVLGSYAHFMWEADEDEEEEEGKEVLAQQAMASAF